MNAYRGLPMTLGNAAQGRVKSRRSPGTPDQMICGVRSMPARLTSR